MIISAVLVSVLLMSTATTMSEIKDTTFESSNKDYHLNNIKTIAQDLDLAKKGDRTKFRKTLNYISSYSIDLSYWEQRRCYNMTLSRTDEQTGLTCVGNGSIFNDGFEDGEYTNPLWVKGQDGNMEVVTEYSPKSESRSLLLQESGQIDTEMTSELQESFQLWDKSWRAEGLFKTEALDKSTAQNYKIILNANSTHNQKIELQIGITDSSGNNIDFKYRNEGLINNVQNAENVNWQENTWYQWEVSHDGSGNYDAKIWESANSKPANPDTEATGSTSSLNGTIRYRLDGTSGSSFKIKNDYIKLEKK